MMNGLLEAKALSKDLLLHSSSSESLKDDLYDQFNELDEKNIFVQKYK